MLGRLSCRNALDRHERHLLLCHMIMRWIGGRARIVGDAGAARGDGSLEPSVWLRMSALLLALLCRIGCISLA